MLTVISGIFYRSLFYQIALAIDAVEAAPSCTDVIIRESG
jgi:hypothetical protein